MKNSYEIRGGVAAIFIEYKGKVIETIIDTDSLPIAKSMPNTWFLNDNGYVRANFPARRKNRSSLRLHRLLMGSPTGLDIDHINGNKLDNRIKNLRITTRSQNLQNQRIDRHHTKSGIRGVAWFSRDSKWRAYVNKDGKQHHLGYFESLEDAAQAARCGREKFHPFCNENIRSEN